MWKSQGILQRNKGFGIVAILFALLGLALTAAGIAINASFLLDERAIAASRDRMRKLAIVISRNNFSTRSTGPRQYETDVGALPTALSDLLAKPGPVAACAINTGTQKLTGWCGPYTERVFTGENTFSDAWGTAFAYSSASRQIRSYGVNHADDGGAADDLVQGF